MNMAPAYPTKMGALSKLQGTTFLYLQAFPQSMEGVERWGKEKEMATGREERGRRWKSPTMSAVHHGCWLEHRKPADYVNVQVHG